MLADFQPEGATQVTSQGVTLTRRLVGTIGDQYAEILILGRTHPRVFVETGGRTQPVTDLETVKKLVDLASMNGRLLGQWSPGIATKKVAA